MTIFREFQWIEHKKLNLLVSGETEFQHFMEKQKKKEMMIAEYINHSFCRIHDCILSEQDILINQGNPQKFPMTRN